MELEAGFLTDPGLDGADAALELLHRSVKGFAEICRTWHFRRHPSLGNCIEMEWVDGVRLDERFRDRKPDEALFRKIAGELCDAVA